MWKRSGRNAYRWCKVQMQTSKWRKSSFSLARNPCSAGKKLSHSGLGIARRRSRSKGGTSPALCSFVFPACHTCIFATFFRWYFPVLPARPLFPALYPAPPEALEPEVQHLRIAERGAHLLHFTRLDATFGRWGAKVKEMLRCWRWVFFVSFCLQRNPFVVFHQTYCYIWLLAEKKIHLFFHFYIIAALTFQPTFCIFAALTFQHHISLATWCDIWPTARDRHWPTIKRYRDAL